MYCGAQGQKHHFTCFLPLSLFQDWKCYVPGQCQEFSVDFEASQDPDECGKFCHQHNAKLKEGDVHRRG